MADIINIIIDYKQAFVRGLSVTINLCLIIWISGIVIGTILGVLSNKFKKAVGLPQKTLNFIMSGIPVLVFLFWIHYPFQTYFNLNIDPFYTAAITFSVINMLSVSEIVNVAIKDLPNQYITVAKVCGISKKRIFFKIQIPLILRQALPPLLILEVNMLHLTLFASMISVEELFRVSQRIASEIYKPVEIYTGLGIFFLAISLPLNGVALYLRKKYLRDLSEK